MRNKKPEPPSRGDRNIAWVQSHCVVPEGKNVGKPVVLRPWQQDIIRGIYDSPTRRAIISFGRKNGKALSLDTPIPTPAGWRTMGDLRPGDYVFGSDGKPTRVSFVSETHVGNRCWRLTFSDGSSVVADDGHQWLTRHRYRPWAKRRVNGSGFGGKPVWGVVTTPQIAESLTVQRSDGGYESNHKLQCAPALQSPPIDLPLSPYVLGVWLGNGSTGCGIITSGEQDVAFMEAELTRELGAGVIVKRWSKANAPHICTPGTGLHSALRQLCVLNNKHIPELYLNAGTDQRWALLQGCMDTDGAASINQRNGVVRCVYTSVRHELAYGVWRLARSLGLKASIRQDEAVLNGRVTGPCFDVSFTADAAQPVFRLPRKQGRLRDKIGGRSRTITITGCDEVPSVPTRCIQVEAPDSLFLCGHGCIPTHNTALSAMLLLLHLAGPEARANSQLYSAAQSRDQAAIVFSLCAKMVRLNPTLSRYVAIRDTAKQLYCEELGTLYRALSADASTAYGLSPVLTICDELGQVKGPKSELFEALETASAAHENPLTVIISTQAASDADLLSVLIDDAKTGQDPKTKLFLYTCLANVDPFSDEALKAANPAFGDFQSADELRSMAAAAKRMPSREAEYLNLILNMRVEAASPFVSKGVWQNNGDAPLDDFGDYPVYAGLDLSETSDLTAFVMVGRVGDTYHVKPVFWLPHEGLAEKSRRDRVPYDQWNRDGYLDTTPGRAVEYRDVAKQLWSYYNRYDIRAIAFDRYNMRHLRPWLLEAGFSEYDLERFTEFGQGFVSMSPALRELETLLLNNKLKHGNHPVLTANAANATIESDPAGNRKLSKKRSRGRIDGMVSLAMAVSVATTASEAKPAFTSIWDTDFADAVAAVRLDGASG